MNRVALVGNVTRDPELRKTQADVSVCTFSIAVNRRFKNNNGEREADFVPIVAWRGTADNCYRYLKKGDRVAVSGSLQIRSYQDKEGNRKSTTEVIADEVEFINVKASAPARKTLDDYYAETDGDPFDMTPTDGEDLPF